mmetsp:Transcript_107271/g.185928  ORF Transcript_107271/g.185928 Transcript_107271/m.185928 type:complete len:442 (+) Transcript_107271:64-1389(+)
MHHSRSLRCTPLQVCFCNGCFLIIFALESGLSAHDGQSDVVEQRHGGTNSNDEWWSRMERQASLLHAAISAKSLTEMQSSFSVRLVNNTLAEVANDPCKYVNFNTEYDLTKFKPKQESSVLELRRRVAEDNEFDKVSEAGSGPSDQEKAAEMKARGELDAELAEQWGLLKKEMNMPANPVQNPEPGKKLEASEEQAKTSKQLEDEAAEEMRKLQEQMTRKGSKSTSTAKVPSAADAAHDSEQAPHESDAATSRDVGPPRKPNPHPGQLQDPGDPPPRGDTVPKKATYDVSGLLDDPPDDPHPQQPPPGPEPDAGGQIVNGAANAGVQQPENKAGDHQELRPESKATDEGEEAQKLHQETIKKLNAELEETKKRIDEVTALKTKLAKEIDECDAEMQKEVKIEQVDDSQAHALVSAMKTNKEDLEKAIALENDEENRKRDIA